MRARFASRELSLGIGLVCHPERGGERPQMLVKRRNKRVISNVWESGGAPLGGNNKSHCDLCKFVSLREYSELNSLQ